MLKTIRLNTPEDLTYRGKIMTEKGYQGYENWETWNVSLWLSNDEGLYNQTTDLLLQNPPRYSEPAKAYFADEASEALEEFVEELLYENVITDKISVHRIDWQEVIMGFQSELESYMDKSQQPEWGDYISDLMVWRSWFKQVEKNPDGNYA